MSNNNAFLVQGDTIVAFVNGKSITATRQQYSNFDDIVEAIGQGEYDKAEHMLDPTATLSERLNGRLRITNRAAFWDDSPLDNSLVRRLVRFLREGLDVKPLEAFLENLMQNPSYTAINETYDFLEANDLPITIDGCFLAYKQVKRNEEGGMVDCYTGTIANDVGCVVKMNRQDVDDDRTRTCSAGLHICSMGYLQDCFGMKGEPVVICKVNPRDVVSVPTDYNNSKMRCCQYEVIAVHEDGHEDTLRAPVYSVQTGSVEEVTSDAE